jgi:selenocysteine lyase/cysteine desulfurase
MAERLWCHTASGTWDKPELGCERLGNVGTSNLTLLIGLVAAIDFHNRIGAARILSRENYLAQTLRSELSQIKGVWFGNGAPPDLSAAMVKVMLPLQKLGQMADKLWEDHKIWVTGAEASDKLPPSIRLSCPIYLTEDDLQRTVAILKQELTRSA